MDYLTSTQAAKMIGVTAPTLHRWQADGTGPNCYVLPSNTLRYREEDVKSWMRKHYQANS